jgi:hypothetical protein
MLPEIWPDNTWNHSRAVASSTGGDLLRRVTTLEVGGWMFSLSLRVILYGSVGSTIVKPSAAHSDSVHSFHGSV